MHDEYNHHIFVILLQGWAHQHMLRTKPFLASTDTKKGLEAHVPRIANPWLIITVNRYKFIIF